MISLVSPSNNIFFNLAAEEYFLKNFTENIAFFYINTPCVVVGKHQNALAESNYAYLQENNIPLARRLSGGGTVFHDAGNINFSFIRNFTESAKSVDFRSFLNPVMDFLHSVEVPAEYSDRNDLLVEGKKFSGNAEHVHQQGKRTLHHGTILFNSELDKLGVAITNKDKNYTHKAVASVRSKVANIASYLKENLEVYPFTERIMNHFLEKEGAEHYTFTKEDLGKIEQLVKEKFDTWEWNIGYSPKYRLDADFEQNGSVYSIHTSVLKGVMDTCEIKRDSKAMDLSKCLEGERLEWNSILKLVQDKTMDPELAKNLTQRLF